MPMPNKTKIEKKMCASRGSQNIFGPHVAKVNGQSCFWCFQVFKLPAENVFAEEAFCFKEQSSCISSGKD